MELARLLLPVATSLFVEGCLLPQEPNTFPDLPPKRNTPPRILPAGRTPDDKVATILIASAGCTDIPPAFSVQVVDEDVGDGPQPVYDTIQHQWFVDRTRGGTRAIGGNPIYDPPSPTRTVTSPPELLNTLSRLTDQERHVVEVYVTDGLFTADVNVVGPSDRMKHKLDGGVNDTAYLDMFSWYVEVAFCH